MSMANSMELRAPFLDINFVSFINSLKHHRKSRYLDGKIIFKQAFNNILPKEIIKRKKKGFGVPIGPWFKKELKEIFCDTFQKDKINRDELFSYEFINNLLNEHVNDVRDNRNLLWSLLIFQLWYDRWVKAH